MAQNYQHQVINKNNKWKKELNILQKYQPSGT